MVYVATIGVLTVVVVAVVILSTPEGRQGVARVIYFVLGWLMILLFIFAVIKFVKWAWYA